MLSNRAGFAAADAGVAERANFGRHFIGFAKEWACSRVGSAHACVTVIGVQYDLRAVCSSQIWLTDPFEAALFPNSTSTSMGDAISRLQGSRLFVIAIP